MCEFRGGCGYGSGSEKHRIALEVVYQTLTSVHAALARQRTAPLTDLGSLPPVADISRTVADIQRRTRAVEQAVEELAVLRRTD